MKLSMKKVSLALYNLSKTLNTIKLTIKLPIKSNKVPPNKREKEPAARLPEKDLNREL